MGKVIIERITQGGDWEYDEIETASSDFHSYMHVVAIKLRKS